MKRILVVDDDPNHRQIVKQAFANDEKFLLDEACDGQEAVGKIEAESFDLVLLDVDMPKMNGLEALKKIKQYDPSIIVIMLTAYASIKDAVSTIKDGAYNYIPKPVKKEDVQSIVERAFEANEMVRDIALSSPILKIGGDREFIGTSKGMKKVFEIIDKLTQFETNVLIRGESGTGKELVARAIHFNSSRKDNRFVAINCSAIPENLIESELFGHEKGAFTGADQRKIGKFQYAEGGTVFLDEIGDLAISMQAKLLRVIQEKVFSPIGSNLELGASVRIIAATNQNLEEFIQTNKFREDLYYRLNVLPVYLPALRERKEDIDFLVEHFLKKFNKAHGKNLIKISKDVINILKRYNWPGNIRELENIIERAYILETANELTTNALPEFLTNAESTNEENSKKEILDFQIMKEQFEKDFIIKALKTFKGKINQTAEHANIPKKTLLRKLEKYGISAKDYK
ncbi:MAG: sigma-54 dependent transcriptional regulator [Pseudomonadota bacterium]